MRTVKPQVLVVTALIVIFTFIFWLVSLFTAYVGDEGSSPPADERSIPAAKTY